MARGIPYPALNDSPEHYYTNIDLENVCFLKRQQTEQHSPFKGIYHILMGTNISEVLSTHQHIETMFASNKVRELQVVIKFGVTQLAVVPRALSYNLDFCNILQAYSNRTSGITLQIVKR